MQIPNKLNPIALKDLMDFPYKENLFAYYYKGKFYLAPNRSYDELDTIQPGPTIIIHSLNNVDTNISFGDGIHLSINAQCNKNSMTFYTSNGRQAYLSTGQSTLKNAIFGGGSNGYYYGYYPDNYNLESNNISNSVIKNKNYAQNVKFSCCFDRKLSKAEFDEVARWILRTQP